MSKHKALYRWRTDYWRILANLIMGADIDDRFLSSMMEKLGKTPKDKEQDLAKLERSCRRAAHDIPTHLPAYLRNDLNDFNDRAMQEALTTAMDEAIDEEDANADGDDKDT